MGAGFRTFAAASALFLATPATAQLDLKRAEVSHLANGLTVILLEDHSLPMVSAQMLYKSGSRDETAGKTGLAHFLEHLAFRASADFPDAGATEAIYDAGGEWHGYTWLDQTTYYSTMPAGGLDLLLRIEADRMARVIIDPGAIDAEKGAVITEMHGYENDPASVLLDAVTAAAFVSHPYRNNTIGLEGDVAGLTLKDARAFYERHYSPANAVLAIAGDFDPAATRKLVQRHFGAIPARAEPERTKALEPPQRGVRRVELLGPVDRQYFEIAWPAPAASSADFPAFLVLQQLLSGGSGVNFAQNDWGTPSQEGSILHGATADIRSWFIPTADRYLFTVKGSIAANGRRDALEEELATRIASVRSRAPTSAQVEAAKRAVADDLLADVQGTEDAAHQLAFFEGLGAFDMLLSLPERVAAVTPEQVQALAQAYLKPGQRTIGWYGPGHPQLTPALGAGVPRPANDRAGAPAATGPMSPPEVRRLSGSLPLIVQSNPATPAVTVKLLLSGPAGDESPRDLPGLGIITRSGTSADLASILQSTHNELATELLSRRSAELPSDDPEARVEQLIAEQVAENRAGEVRPMALVVSGSVDVAIAHALAERQFGSLKPAERKVEQLEFARPERALRRAVRIDKPLSQGALGYVAPAPPPGTRESLAARMLLYILTHDYSGRLGRSAIAGKGLVYFIGSDYRTDGNDAWVTISAGVDPARADAFEAELKDQLARLASTPPSPAEIEAARRHLLGRDLSGAQTNDEIAGKLIRNFVETGGLRSHSELKAMLDTISVADVTAAIPALTHGTILRVDVAAN